MERGTGISPAQTGQIVKARRLAFVLAKGGITSSDVATEALAIDRHGSAARCCRASCHYGNRCRGPQKGLPYVVFAGNVGDEHSLADVIDRLETC